MLVESKVKLYRDIIKQSRKPAPRELFFGFEHNSTFAKRKKRTLTQLGAEERVAIAKLAASKTLTQREIAERHNVSTQLVTRLLFSMKHDLQPFIKRKARELKSAQEHAAIIHCVKQSLGS